MYKVSIKLPISNTDKERSILEKQGLIYKQECCNYNIDIELGKEDFNITIEKEN